MFRVNAAWMSVLDFMTTWLFSVRSCISIDINGMISRIIFLQSREVSRIAFIKGRTSSNGVPNRILLEVAVMKIKIDRRKCLYFNKSEKTLQSSKVTAGFYDWIMPAVSMQINLCLNSLSILPSTVYSMCPYPDSMYLRILWSQQGLSFVRFINELGDH